MKKDNLTLDDFLSRFQLLRPQVNRATLNQRQAAVLIPVVRREQPGLLLTQRSPHMLKHAGQVAFPGGAVDSTDASLIAAALREAHEEVAIPPEAVEVIGVLPPVDSVTGFQVTPVVGIIPPDLQYHASVDEVSAVFEMPLEEALRLGRYHPLDIHRRGHDHRVWLSWYQHYFVWGMTAGIIRELALQIGLKP
ncbi:CoA pyrophosphatase [Enterobacter hormaechei]|uniref:CoA pyrophosphatase n=1 Tax=Enterobacter hormaechei TaxID=158836 RepID=UPI0020755DCA|nr:CoA pyrophosphatase [Enterobacter hormaechei]MCM7623705.1 CoA pyrophosphatase [Enterobacter hormaechei]MCW4683667.1 CoA pyrophosphatase [Enterobacter hormaechei subsp. xiangfangensis]MCW4785198.1 CoA pyrophosphatase [Enterobacter hormaechei subsp. xiangfangensis]MCW4813476.1 CoA pyrophosphatase [Enterobacter hormaechei subsp. xiangfangensis]MCW4824228.1 CoA pyrophosphatase [Enterobacter hormaechei subsp. xiangfangensis]